MIKINKIAVASMLTLCMAGSVLFTGCSGEKESAGTVQENVEENTDETNQGEENQNATEGETNTTGGIVTDADYADKSLAGKVIKLTSEEEISYDDFKVPVINLEGGDIDKINGEIKTTFDAYSKLFADSVKEAEAGKDVESATKSKYQAYLNNNVISVVYEAIDTDIYDYPTYYIYNIDKTSNKILSFEALCKEVQMTSSDAKAKFKALIEKNYNELDKEAFGEGESAEGYIKSAYDAFESGLSKEEVPYYINGQGQMTFIFEMPLPSGLGGAGDMRSHYAIEK